mmetsp:Transcript_5769/g.9108  ORF Transcript_5769/g.9108 Transcript_5769/m.9108 type:complete len:413 (+) Transcript_5769:332-1570(+)
MKFRHGISSQRRNITTCQNSIIQARVMSQPSSKHGFSRTRSTMQQQVTERRLVLFGIGRRNGNFCQLGLQIRIQHNSLESIRFLVHSKQPLHSGEGLRECLSNTESTGFTDQTWLPQTCLYETTSDSNGCSCCVYTHCDPSHCQCRVSQFGRIVQVGLQSLPNELPSILNTFQDSVASLDGFLFQFFQHQIMVFSLLTNSSISFCLRLGQFHFGFELGFVFGRLTTHLFLPCHHFLLLFQLLFLHILLSVQHVNLSFTFQLVHILGTMTFVLCLGIQGLACFFGFSFDVLRPLLLSVRLHFGSFGSGFMLLGHFLRFDQFNGLTGIPTGIKFPCRLGGSFQSFRIKSSDISTASALFGWIFRRHDAGQIFSSFVVISTASKHDDDDDSDGVYFFEKVRWILLNVQLMIAWNR